MEQKINSEFSAGTAAEQPTKDDVLHVSPACIKPNVVRSLSKVVVSELKKIDKTIEMEYPIYLYFQDESCNDELIMLTKEYQIKVKYEYFSLIIEKSKGQMIYEHWIKNNLTTKEHFLEVYNEALNLLKGSVKF